MENTQRIGETMRSILVVLNATQGSPVNSRQLAKAIEASESSTRHSAARLAARGLIRNQGNEHQADWRITESGLDVLNAIHAKEGGAAGS